MRVLLDASAIIFTIEGAPSIKAAARRRLEEFLRGGDELIASWLCWIECRVKPLRDDQREMLSRYEAFLQDPLLRLHEINFAVLDEATRVRANYGFKTPDAIHVATAMIYQADRILTGDALLNRFNRVEVEILTP